MYERKRCAKIILKYPVRRNKSMKSFKKVLAVFLCVAMTVPGLCIGVYASDTCDCGNTPIVYMYGKQTIYLTREDGSKVNPLARDDLDIGGMVKEVVPDIAKSMATGNWDEYCEKVYNMLAPIWKDVKVDGNGYPINPNTGIAYSWSPETVTSRHSYGFDGGFLYLFDWRLSPMDVADDMHDFIETVKKKTGHDKVVLVSRCMATSYEMAYLYKYERPRNYSGIEKVVLFNPSTGGLNWLESAFSGKVVIDPDSAYRYIQGSVFEDKVNDDALVEVLKLVFNSLKETYGLNLACRLLQNKIYPAVKDKLFARLVKEFYGTAGGVLAMIRENFDECIDYIYPTDADKAEYAGLIEKAKYYHDNVTMHVADILKEIDALGKPVAIYGEYGGQQRPVSADAAYCGDYSIALDDQTLGATVSKVDGRLSDKYLAAAAAEGRDKYISPDRQVDASTCLFPDTTWFIKNANHEFPAVIDYLMLSFIRGKAPDVWSNEAYPQYLNFNPDAPLSGQLEPAQEVNANDIDWAAYETGDATITIILETINTIIKTVNYLIKTIKEIVAVAKGTAVA